MNPARTIWVSVLLVMVASSVVAGVEFQKLTLRKETTVTASMVKLNDVVRDCPPAMRAIKIMAAPRWGATARVTRDEVLKRIYRVSRRRVWLDGADAVRVIRPGADRAGEIAGELRRALDTRIASLDGVGYEMRFPDRAIVLPPGALAVECRLPETLEGYRVVRLRVRMAGGLTRNINVACRFIRSVKVPVASHRLMRGDTLRHGDLRWEVQTFNRAVPAHFDEHADATLYRLRRTVAEGTPITDTVVERHPAVRAGQEVQLVLERPSVRLTARARALQTGWVGSRIRVQNLVDKRYMYARVVSKGVVIHE